MAAPVRTPCRKCSGTGKVRHETTDAKGNTIVKHWRCPVCNGKRWVNA